MHPVRIGAKRKRTVLVLAMALGVGLPQAAQAYLLDCTVTSINPGFVVSYVGSYSLGPPRVESHLRVIDASLTGDLKRHHSPAPNPPHKILSSQTRPPVPCDLHVPAAHYGGVLGGIFPQGSTTLQSAMSGRIMSGGKTRLSGSFGTASVTEPTPTRGDSGFCVAGSNCTENKNDAWLASRGLQRRTTNGNFDPGCAASCASAPGAFTGTMVPKSNILNQLAPFSSTLLLLGCGLMGLAGLRYRRRRG